MLKQGIHKDIEPNKEGMIDGCSEICSTVVLLKAETPDEKNIIVDTGNQGYEDEIISALEKEGLKPEDIEFVIITHSHQDHLSNNYLFKNAKRIIGVLSWNPDKSLDVYDDLTMHNIPFVKIINTTGHTSKHYSVVVESGGKTYVIAGDAIQEWIIREEGYTNQDQIESAKKILEIADVIIPGHDRIIQGGILEELKQIANNWG